MAGYAEALKLDSKRLERRLIFLLDRANAHDKEGAKEGDQRTVDLHRGCSATLRRDAGAIAILLGKTQDARSYFRVAGQQWAGLRPLFWPVSASPRPTAEKTVFRSGSGYRLD